ncbi:hypothetical protein GQ600_23901 [Phytophthora cactorum]|nr:hypothetical protein GQ600_23901 [Phytophthora cactorum]
MKLCYLLVVAVTSLQAALLPRRPISSSLQITQLLPGQRNTDLRGLKPKPMNDTDDETKKRNGGRYPLFGQGVRKMERLTVEEKFNTPEGLMLAKASNDRFMKIYKLYGLFNFLGKAAFIQWLKGIKAAAQK